LIDFKGWARIPFPKIQNCKSLTNFRKFPSHSQKIEQPFLAAVETTLGDRYTQNVEGIYKQTIKFIIETLVAGYNESAKNKNNTNATSNNNTNVSTNDS
jgi:hypothetical protein